ncbi:MAG: Dolichyl-phosphate-mannose-protein mannosyltransferase [Verrucomicrobia bacterium]|nr:Dolichyl-phosphate-mannose-protein mannosyltransferase [Verrucomicrobiota bacterium]
MGAAEFVLNLGRLALLGAGLLLPGALILRALDLPRFLAGCVIGSAAALYGSVLILTLAHLPITLATLAASLGIVSFACVAGARRFTPAKPDEPHPGFFSFLTKLGPWTPLYVAFWAVIVWRLATQPLNGGDIDFRWSWLAEQMVRLGSLDFYPPIVAGDFANYFWVESIPPGVATLHAWGYLCGGDLRELWTSPGVLLQLLALHDLLWRLAFNWGGLRAARRALILACAAPLLNWAAIMGQETGLTALALAGLLHGLVRWKENAARGWLAFAALAAFVGAGAREYGLVFPLLGILVLALMRARPRAILTFAGWSLAPSLLWPLRVWLMAGNPFYSLGVGTLFPTNPLFVEWARSISAGSEGLLATSEGWRQLLRYFVLGAPAALLCWCVIGLRAIRRNPPAIWCGAAILAIGCIWYASLAYTGGGLFYSMRVLAPAFALGMVFGGIALASDSLRPWARRCWNAAVLLVFLATLPLTLTFPHNAYHLPVREWAGAGGRFVEERRRADAQVGQFLLRQPDHDRILTECVSLPRALAPSGITAVPMWSPGVDWLFDRAASPSQIARHWRESGLRYVVMTRSPQQLELLSRRAGWVAPNFSIRRIWQSDGYVIFDVSAPLLAHH